MPAHHINILKVGTEQFTAITHTTSAALDIPCHPVTQPWRETIGTPNALKEEEGDERLTTFCHSNK